MIVDKVAALPMPRREIPGNGARHVARGAIVDVALVYLEDNSTWVGQRMMANGGNQLDLRQAIQDDFKLVTAEGSPDSRLKAALNHMYAASGPGRIISPDELAVTAIRAGARPGALGTFSSRVNDFAGVYIK